MFPATVFGLPHLSEDAVAAFADGMLSPSAAARAARHCADCAECAEAVQVQRDAASILRSAALPSVPSSLLHRLSAVPMSAPIPPPFGGLPTVIGSDGQPVFLTHEVSVETREGSADRTVETTAAEPTNQNDSERLGHQGRRPMRRVVIPLGIAASVAAVVAAGTLAGQSRQLNGPATGGSANLSGVVTTSGGSAPAAPASQLLDTSVIGGQLGPMSTQNGSSGTREMTGSGVAAGQPARVMPAGFRMPN
jgi:hypothetical protein